MSDLNDLSRPVLTDTEPNVLDTLKAHIVRAATWTGWSGTANKVAGIMSGVTAAVSGGQSLRLYRRNDANTTNDEVVSLPGISVGGNAATASAAQAGSALQTALDAKAPLASPALTGTPTAPTAAAGTATTQLANTAFVATAVANLVQSSPAALDTLNELAASLGNDPNFAASTATALGNRVSLVGDQTVQGTKTFASVIQGSVSGNAGTVTYPFPAGTRMPFAQASAPTGWTKDTSDNANDRMLRVVNTAGGGVAGTHSPIVNNVVPAHTHGFTTGNVSSDHTHYAGGGTSGSGEHSGWLDGGLGGDFGSFRAGGGVFSTGNSYGNRPQGAGGTGSSYTAYLNVGTHAHSWSGWTGGTNSDHTHSGSTDNGSSQTNWQPRYINLIICTKN